ncbi:MAG: polysaccharide deacetylase family protein [Sideroxydans sp.]|nr:polysaccharide deacetylase family protein [Sideroxydans sp.]
MFNQGRLKQVTSALPIMAALCVSSLAPLTAMADYVGPAVVAKANRQLWGETINTPAGFDRASRASILVYILALQDMQRLSEAEMLTSFKIKSVNRASVEKWLGKEYGLSLLNYQRASTNCSVSDWTCIGNVTTIDDLEKKAADAKLRTPPNLLAWRDNLDNFSRAYIAEQLRLAALFPKVSSEIDFFNENEWNGDAFSDRQFYLSFDDGPTGTQGNTDETLGMLETEKKSAVFFVLGENLQARLKKADRESLTELYTKQCVASHGWEHQSHAKWNEWQDSIKRTQSLLNETLSKYNVVPLFRPPYGQRKDDSGEFFQSQSLHVALWNLDSQDWNSHVTIDDITNRMITLMLIKRHGMLLFHDVHPKAKAALPQIFKELGSTIEWGDCHQLTKL